MGGRCKVVTELSAVDQHPADSADLTMQREVDSTIKGIVAGILAVNYRSGGRGPAGVVDWPRIRSWKSRMCCSIAARSFDAATSIS